MTRSTQGRDEARQGLTLPRRALRRLTEVGIYANPAVSLEHQHRGHRYVVRGIESGGAVEEIGHYVTFCDQGGAPLVWLHPLDSVGVNGVHALVIASTLVRVEMLRVGHTYDLFITQHSPGLSDHRKRPPLESKILFRAHEGYLALDLVKENKDQRGSVMPAFHSRAGELLPVPVEFEAVVKAITGAASVHRLSAFALPSGAWPRRSGPDRDESFRGARVTPVGDVELEIVFRIAVRGRAGDLAQLLEAVNKAHAVVMWLVETPIASEEQGQKGVTTTAGVNSV